MNYTKGSNVVNQAWQNNHSIDFDNARVIDKGNCRVQKTLESWHTARKVGADNNSKPLPRQYSILLQLDNIYNFILLLFPHFFCNLVLYATNFSHPFSYIFPFTLKSYRLIAES